MSLSDGQPILHHLAELQARPQGHELGYKETSMATGLYLYAQFKSYKLGYRDPSWAQGIQARLQAIS